VASMNNILDGIDKLPALPGSASRVITMILDKTVDIGETIEIVRVDEALSLAVLRYGNSAMYGRPGREFNLKECIVRLGGNTMMKIVLQQQVGTMLETGGIAFGLQRGDMWRGSLGGAFAAEELGREYCESEHELCFLCGLLRDIGKVALDMRYGAEYGTRVAENMEAMQTFVGAERSAFGTDHAEVGAALALRWDLPQRIADAIRYHHDPPENEPNHDILFDIVHAADTLCMWAGLAIGQDGMQYQLAPHVRNNIGLSRRDVEFKMTELWGKVREVEESMNKTPSKEVA